MDKSEKFVNILKDELERMKLNEQVYATSPMIHAAVDIACRADSEFKKLWENQPNMIKLAEKTIEDLLVVLKAGKKENI